MHSFVLVALLLIPLVGSLIAFGMREEQALAAKFVGLIFSVATLAYTVVLCFRWQMGNHAPRFQWQGSWLWIKTFGVHIAFGVDGIALVLVLMSVILVPAVLLASWNAFDSRAGAESADEYVGTARSRVGALAATRTPEARPTAGDATGGIATESGGASVAGSYGAGEYGAGHGGATALGGGSAVGTAVRPDEDDDLTAEDLRPVSSGSSRRRTVKNWVGLLLLLEFFMVGVFISTDVFLFYVFFEAMLVPMYFVIGSFGGPRRQYAAMKFFLYSLVGGLLMLASVIGLYITTGSRTFSFTQLIGHVPDGTTQKWLFLGFAVAFAIKAPLVPFHTWLPDAGAEAPVGGAALLVGVLDKVGTFGFIRYCLPLFPQASSYFAPAILILSVIGILYAAFLAIGQRDMKRLVSYTSVAHFGFIGLGIFAFTTQGGSGAVLYMVNHGWSTGALFLVVGFLIARGKSRNIADYGGTARVTPILAGLFLMAGLSSLALPGMSTFVSEFLVLVGTFTRHKALAIVGTTGIILAAIYILFLYQRTFQGVVKERVQKFRDLNIREVVAVAPLLALIIFFGFYPKPLLDIINPAVHYTLQDVHKHDPAPELASLSGVQK